MARQKQSEKQSETISKRSTRKKATYRTLRPGEPIPPHTHELRYLNSGYVVIRWTVGPEQYVEVREHRLAVGALPGEHVHHKNHSRSDNRSDNLVRVSPQDHSAHHAVERHPYVIEEVIAMYNNGKSTLTIGKHFGCDHSIIYRALVKAGIQPRKRGIFSDEHRRVLRDISREGWQDPEVRKRRTDGMKAAWSQRTPERRAEISKRISEVKRTKKSRDA